MGRYSYTPKGVCSRAIELELDNGLAKNIHFTGGCNGRGTSCPDQLANAIELAVEEESK